ncbi:iron-sulfur cluster co-chaperone protein HscB [Patella vulgata]|uniref:iron-sulfur cluster co-chaperone protein HscB n=1 Tax=Patella vulgata TaxID=6465 RepID=UPI0024A8A319|nr:iron-sulfur cluster co-chaperone protein HscB [Patella vulgata]
MSASMSLNACRVYSNLFTISKPHHGYFRQLNIVPKETKSYWTPKSYFGKMPFLYYAMPESTKSIKVSLNLSPVSTHTLSRRHKQRQQQAGWLCLRTWPTTVDLISTEQTCRFHSSPLVFQNNKACWKCGKKIDAKSELFFCECGIVQKVTPNISYFTLFDLSENYKIDIWKLYEAYINLQKRLHPDKFTQASEEEKLYAEKQSSLINKAYTTLSKPLSRAIYMLKIHNKPIEEDSALSDPEFLAEVMEINEELAELSSPENLKDLEEQNLDKIDLCINQVAEAFDNNDIVAAHKLVVKYQYYANITEKIKEIHRKLMV